MKRFKIVFASLLLLAVTGGLFAFTSHKNVNKGKYFVGSYFTYSGTAGQEHDPTKYTLASTQSAVAGTAKLVWIFVDASEIYSSSDPNFPNKPKVDIASGSTIQSLITSALTAPKADKDITSPFAEHVELGN